MKTLLLLAIAILIIACEKEEINLESKIEKPIKQKKSFVLINQIGYDCNNSYLLYYDSTTYQIKYNPFKERYTTDSIYTYCDSFKFVHTYVFEYYKDTVINGKLYPHSRIRDERLIISKFISTNNKNIILDQSIYGR